MSSLISAIGSAAKSLGSAAQSAGAASSWILPRAGWTYKSDVATLAESWVGRNLNWIAYSPTTLAQSTIHNLLQANQTPPATAPDNTYSMSCLELPLLAAWRHGAIWATKTAKILADPANQLSIGWAKTLGGGAPQKGDLVTWRARPSDLLQRAFGGGGGADTPKLGLAHVTLATGRTGADGSAEVVSFWGDYLHGNAVGPVELTTITVLSAAPGLNGCEVVWGPPNW